MLAVERARFAADPAQRARLLGVGEAPTAAGLDPTEHAACAEVARMLLNLSEALTRS